MISSTIALAFTAGMIATFNPCGFSLLPAYIGAFVTGDEVSEGADRRVLRAIGVAAAVSIGFVLLFSTVGLIIDSIAGQVQQQLPWITIFIGAILVTIGFAMAAGWQPKLAIGGPQLSTGSNRTVAMVGYGITYAVASLSCTIGPFLAVTGAALAQSPLEAAATYVAYALGMGVIILALSIAAALAHTTIAHHMQQFSQYAPRVGGVLMVLAGSYAIWYGRWELAVYDGDLSDDPVVDRIENLRLWFVAEIHRIGAGRLTLIIGITIVATITVARLARTTTSTVEAPHRPGPSST